MAYQIDSKKHRGRIKGAGADVTRASKPAEQTYRYPLERGLPKMQPRKDADGNPIAESGYGRGGYAGPSSVSVTDSAKLADFDIGPKSGDDALDSLIANGHGDSTGESNAVADLQRKISTEGYPVHSGTRGASPGPKVPGSPDFSSQAEPVRKPGS